MRGPIRDPSSDRSYCGRSLSLRPTTPCPALPRPWFIHDAGRYRGGSFQRQRISHAICAARRRRRRSEVCRSYLMRRHVRARPKNILVYLLSNQHGRRRSVWAQITQKFPRVHYTQFHPFSSSPAFPARVRLGRVRFFRTFTNAPEHHLHYFGPRYQINNELHHSAAG